MLEWLSFNETGGKNMYDFILKNGNVIDVKNEKIDQADIAVKDGKVWQRQWNFQRRLCRMERQQ